MAQRFVFVCGLHRSGTSVLHRALRRHPDISGFSDTGVIEDEGQFLQSVMRPDLWYGGAGLYGFNRASHLSERSSLVSDDSARRIYSEWARYWDLDRPVLVEKTPTNLVRTRFLQRLYPDSSFVICMRHPIAVSVSNKEGRRWIPFWSLIEHWVFCHEWFLIDASYLNRVHVVWYEGFCAAPQKTLDEVCDFLDLPRVPIAEPIRSADDKRFAEWQGFRETRTGRLYAALLSRTFEKRIARFGYSLRNPKQVSHRPFLDLIEAYGRRDVPRATVLSRVAVTYATVYERHLRARLRKLYLWLGREVHF